MADLVEDALAKQRVLVGEVGVDGLFRDAGALRDAVQGVYVIPAFGRYDLAAEILDAVRTD